MSFKMPQPKLKYSRVTYVKFAFNIYCKCFIDKIQELTSRRYVICKRWVHYAHYLLTNNSLKNLSLLPTT